MGNEWAPEVTTLPVRRGSADVQHQAHPNTPIWKESVSKVPTVGTLITLSSGPCHGRPKQPRNPWIS